MKPRAAGGRRGLTKLATARMEALKGVSYLLLCCMYAEV
jgi:hypothetical protein